MNNEEAEEALREKLYALAYEAQDIVPPHDEMTAQEMIECLEQAQREYCRILDEVKILLNEEFRLISNDPSGSEQEGS